MCIDIQLTTGQVREPAIHVHAMEKSYDELHVLRGVDFDVARGSIFALLGSNGAGKTTVVNILSTLLKPDAGTATVAGFDVATHPADVRESISLTGQFAAVVPHAADGGGDPRSAHQWMENPASVSDLVVGASHHFSHYLDPYSHRVLADDP